MLRELLAEADIFSQGYRPQALADLGFSPQEAARINPGIVYVSLSAYGHVGPWAEPPRFRLAGADRDRLQSCRRAGRRRRRPEGIAGADARSRHRLSDGVRRHDGEGAPVARRRQLACPRVAGADRAMAVESRPRRRRSQDRGFEGRGDPALLSKRCHRASARCRRSAIRRSYRKRRHSGRGRRCRSAVTRRNGRRAIDAPAFRVQLFRSRKAWPDCRPGSSCAWRRPAPRPRAG